MIYERNPGARSVVEGEVDLRKGDEHRSVHGPLLPEGLSDLMQGYKEWVFQIRLVDLIVGTLFLYPHHRKAKTIADKIQVCINIAKKRDGQSLGILHQA